MGIQVEWSSIYEHMVTFPTNKYFGRDENNEAHSDTCLFKIVKYINSQEI